MPSTTQIVTKSTTAIEIPVAQVVTVYISGYTLATFSGSTFLPRVWIEDDMGNTLYSKLLEIAPPNSTTPHSSSYFGETVSLSVSTYFLMVKARTFINAAHTDHVSAQLNWFKPAENVYKKPTSGLRIKNLNYLDFNGNLQYSKKQMYGLYLDPAYNTNSGYSSGVIKAEPKYVYESKTLAFENNATNTIVECEYFQLLGASQILIQRSQGYHVSYREVKTITTDENRGYTISQYDSPYEFPYEVETQPPYSNATSAYYKTGLLKQEIKYNANENIVQSTVN
ncbi:MAG: hypothetical protein V3V00_02275 [Saprospiraceae bacterium]